MALFLVFVFAFLRSLPLWTQFPRQFHRPGLVDRVAADLLCGLEPEHQPLYPMPGLAKS